MDNKVKTLFLFKNTTNYTNLKNTTKNTTKYKNFPSRLNVLSMNLKIEPFLNNATSKLTVFDSSPLPSIY